MYPGLESGHEALFGRLCITQDYDLSSAWVASCIPILR